MTRAITDKFQKVMPGTITKLMSPGKAVGSSLITVESTTNFPTDTGFTVGIRSVDYQGNLIAGTYTEWEAVLETGNNITLGTLVYGNDQAYQGGDYDQVFIPLSSASYNRMLDGILVEHNQDGTHNFETLPAQTGHNGEYLTTDGTDASWGDVPSTVSIVSNEVPSGTVDSSNTTFTTASAYVGGSLSVYINGVKQALTTHYTETTPASGIFDMGDAPLAGDVITVSYQTAAAATGNADTVDNYHVNATATANTLLPLDNTGKLPITVIKNPYKCSVKLSANQTITTATFTTVQFDTVNYDTLGMFNTTTYRFTPAIDGDYYLATEIWASNADGTYVIGSIKLNGTTYIAEARDTNTASTNRSVIASRIYPLTTSDYIEVQAYISDSTTPTINKDYTWFEARLMEAA